MPAAAANNNVRNLDDVSGPEAWYRALPIVTRNWFGLAIVTTLGGNLGLVSVTKLVFAWQPLKDNFEVWRLFTPFLYMGEFGISMLFGLYFLVEYSKRYESSSGYNTGAGGGTADYVFALIFAVVSMLVSYPFLATVIMPLFGRNLTYFVLYIWSKRYPTMQVSIWGFPVPALYLPFALCALSVCMGNSVSDLVHGIVIGHLYYFLVDVVPMVYGKDVLHTPQFLIDYFGVGAFNPPPTAAAQPAREAGASGGTAFNAPGRVNPPENPGLRRRMGGGGYQWGEGRALGNN